MIRNLERSVPAEYPCETRSPHSEPTHLRKSLQICFDLSYWLLVTSLKFIGCKVMQPVLGSHYIEPVRLERNDRHWTSRSRPELLQCRTNIWSKYGSNMEDNKSSIDGFHAVSGLFPSFFCNDDCFSSARYPMFF